MVEFNIRNFRFYRWERERERESSPIVLSYKIYTRFSFSFFPFFCTRVCLLIKSDRIKWELNTLFSLKYRAYKSFVFFFFFLSSFFPLFFSYHRICIADISSFDIITPSRGRGLCNNFHIGSIEKRRYLRLLWRYAKIAETTRLNKVTAHGEIKIRLHRIRVLFFPSNHLQREYSDNYRPLFLRKLNIQNTQKKFDDKKKNENKKIQNTIHRIKIVRPDKFPIMDFAN